MGKKAESTPPDNPDTIQIVELLQRRKLTDHAFEIELTRPPSLEFKAGQTIRFIHETIERYYSPVSTPKDPTLTLCVYNVPQGRFSPILARAEVGAARRSAPLFLWPPARASRPLFQWAVPDWPISLSFTK